MTKRLMFKSYMMLSVKDYLKIKKLLYMCDWPANSPILILIGGKYQIKSLRNKSLLEHLLS